jgi:ABC-type Fe3+ transport system permease subunit/DNA-binding beta-propeller fold protein YncE
MLSRRNSTKSSFDEPGGMNWILLQNSLLVSGLATVLAAGFGVCSALWLASLPAGWRKLFFALAIVSLALPPFLVTNCWLDLLGPTGLWRRWVPFNIISLGGTAWILALLLWPITTLAAWSSWQRLEPAQLESDLAVKGWALWRVLLWPLARMQLGQAAVLTFVLALNNFAVPAILQVKVFPAEIWIRFNTSFDTPGALRLSLPLILVPMAALVWFIRRGVPWPSLQATVSPRLLRTQLGRTAFLFSGAAAIAVALLSAVVPVLQLALFDRTWTELPGAFAAGYSAVWNSLVFAVLAAAVVLFFSLALVPRLGRAKYFAGWALWVPFLVPGVLLGITLILLFNRKAFSLIYNTPGMVLLAFALRYVALGWNTTVHALDRTDHDLTNAARLEGVSGWQMLRHVYWPQIGPPVAVAGYIIFLLCLWDVESLILIVPPGRETLSLRIFNLLHYGHNAQVNALCLILLALALAPLGIWAIWSVARCYLPNFGPIVTRRSLLALLPVAAVLFTSCKQDHANTRPVKSRLFSRVQVIGSRGVGVGELNKPRSVAVDRADSLYVVDMTGRVQKFSSNGTFLLSWQLPQTDKGRPKGMCRDREGNLVVNEPHYSRVNHFTPEGMLVKQWGRHGTNAGLLAFPRAAAINSRNEVFVSEYGLVERVQRFSLAPGVAAGVSTVTNFCPQFLNAFGQMGSRPGEFNRPEGLCLDAQDRLYVADSCNHRIQIFTSDGEFIRCYGKAGSGLGEMSYPYDICVDSAGRQYVCEFGNSRIQVFDAQDRPIEILGQAGTAPGQFGNPWGVALDSAGNLYVADSQNHRVQKFVRSP